MPLKSNKILIVEDDKFLSNIYSTVFEKEGFAVVVAEDGENGFAQAKEIMPDIIILDIMLPGKMNGLRVLEEIKKINKLNSIPVIILSNLGDDATISDGLRLGANGYFIKSQVNPDDVVRNVRSILE